jgi:hypothetical protein
MSEWISDREPSTKEEKPQFNRSKTVQIIISILVALALWVYVDVEKAPERTKTIGMSRWSSPARTPRWQTKI